MWWEKDDLREASEFERREPLRLGAGAHEVMVIKEGREITTTFEDKEIEKVVFDVDYDGKTYAWFVTKGSTTDSLFGQMVKVGKLHGGLAGKKLKIMVAGQGKNKRYQLMELDGVPVPR